MEIVSGRYDRLGAHVEEGGVNFAVFSENAARIELCLFDKDGAETGRLDLPERTGSVWHGFVPELEAGAKYGYRAHGLYAPDRGHRFNPNKLLLDPYARALDGALVESDALYGHDVMSAEEDLSFDARDSAPFMPKGVVLAPLDRSTVHHPRNAWDETVIYEAHVKGLTQRLEAIDGPVRGSYDALGHPVVINHLKALGITAVELLPAQAFQDEPFLSAKGLTNYWGYNPLNYFAVAPRYLGPGGIEGFRQAIAALHDAGIEVILDVVYNHTCEGGHQGPTLSFRGLDNHSYYRLQRGRMRFNIDDTGCGNTVDVAHPFVARMVLDSLRYWVEDFGIDGFRFDLATTVAREAQGFDPRGGFLDALSQDPVLSGVKLIAEPWDIGPGGYRLGGFPAPFAEWNDRFRDDVRKFWRGDQRGAHALAARLLGSAEVFDEAGRAGWSSINLITAHDGFTLADVVSFNDKHNEANLEDNRDGHNGNYSDNCGAEGATDDPEILKRRARRQRNLLTTLFVSQGTPMLLAGDEFGNSQDGNNNAYCQDNEIGWLDWPGADQDLLSFARRLTALRRAHPALRQSRFMHGRVRADDGAPDVIWGSFHGETANWRDPNLETFTLRVRGSAEVSDQLSIDDDVLLAFNTNGAARDLVLPPPPEGRIWWRVLDTAQPELEAAPVSGSQDTVEPDCVAVFSLSKAHESGDGEPA